MRQCDDAMSNQSNQNGEPKSGKVTSELYFVPGKLGRRYEFIKTQVSDTELRIEMMISEFGSKEHIEKTISLDAYEHVVLVLLAEGFQKV